MDLVREILIYFEERDAVSHKQASAIEIAGRDTRAIQYHVDLMYEAGLLSCEERRDQELDEPSPRSSVAIPADMGRA